MNTFHAVWIVITAAGMEKLKSTKENGIAEIWSESQSEKHMALWISILMYQVHIIDLK